MVRPTHRPANSKMTGGKMNPLVELQSFGQSFWYDNIRRNLLLNGTVQKLIDQDGLRGMTSNPTIFGKAIAAGVDYDEQIIEAISEGLDTNSIYEALALRDIRFACDLFADIYGESGRKDGFVSLEVSPLLANDTEGTISEAKRLFGEVDRANVMIKVPATAAGIPAITQLIAAGINVNVTLMFSMAHYEAVAGAYIEGIKRLAQRGGEISRVSSVASFFVSRVDTMVDHLLAEQTDAKAIDLMGKVAIANSKLVYQRYKEIFLGPEFVPLISDGAQVQRLLWASTSTKNPSYSDTQYVDQLIGPNTVNTMPPATIDVYRDHGLGGSTLESNLGSAIFVFEELASLEINLEQVGKQLQLEGVNSFATSFVDLMETIRHKTKSMVQADI
jgi:transaldolase/glucose-6-phosphate isomerase